MNREWIGCAPHNFRQGRPVGFRPELIVVHVIVGSLLSADRWFNNPAASVSAHYGVGCDGRVHQYVKETDTAFHAGIVVNPSCGLVIDRPNVNPNYYSIGIEHEGQPGDAWTVEQVTASAGLVADIAQRWKIPIDAQHVIQHREIRASKTCPGGQQKVDVLIAGARAFAAQNASVAPAPAPRTPDVAVESAPGSRVQPAVSAVQVQPAVADLGETEIVMNVRVRKGAPSATAPIVNVLQAHTSFKPTGVVIGESVQGNPMWYRDINGNFVWAGGTNMPHPKS